MSGREINADDVLFVLSGQYQTPVSSLEYCVVTQPAQEFWDNTTRRMTKGESWWPFTMGEILVIGPSGREPFNEERKPSKWSVTTEETTDLIHALELSVATLERYEDAGKLEIHHVRELRLKRHWLAQLRADVNAKLTFEVLEEEE